MEDEVRFEVKNNGVTIEQDALDRIFDPLKRGPEQDNKGSFENSVGNAAQRACALNAAKLSFPAMRNKTVRMVSKRAYPRALRFAA
jgi:hypothetical protein